MRTRSMLMRVVAVAAAGAVCSALVVGVGPVAAGRADDAPAWCPAGGDLDAAALPSLIPADSGCDLTGRVVRGGSVALAVPAPGAGISYDSYGPAATELTVASLPDGSVVVSSVPSWAWNPDPLFPEPGPDPCAAAVASAYTLKGWKAYNTIGWYYNSAGEPASVAGAAQAAIAQAGHYMADGNNDCGMTAVPRTSFQTYLGPTSAPVQASVGSCPTLDATSAFGWGSLGAGSGTLAVTCTRFSTASTPWSVVAADMKFSTDYDWSTGTVVGATCVTVHTPVVDVTPPYDVTAVATHEWGHAFGLGHVPETGATETQTMSTNMQGPCERSETTLGRGDLNGMLSIYGSL